MEGLDIGPKTIHKFDQIILNSKTILWNGPLDYLKCPTFKRNQATALSIAEATKGGAFSLVGSGDSISAIKLLEWMISLLISPLEVEQC